MLSWIDDELRGLEHQGLRRRLTVRDGAQAGAISVNGQSLINFGSNDYLGLAGDVRLTQAAMHALQSEGMGSGASPLVAGRSTSHARLESLLAEFEQTEAALLFASGFAANCGAVSALVGPGDIVFADAKNHASLWDGCRLSRADVRVYPHNDFESLTKLLDSAGDRRRRLIVTDSLFSIDGDVAPLADLSQCALRFDAMLLIDEAHATGVYGQNGRGLAEHFSIHGDHIVRVGTLSKALGCSGGFVVGNRSLIDWLAQRARSYIYSTAAPPAIAAAACAAIEIVQSEPRRRVELLERAAELRSSVAGQGFRIGRSTTQIVPIVVGSPERALELAARLRDQGLFVPAIRPPTVPDGEACLRVSLSWQHSSQDIAQLLAALGSPQ